MEPYATGEGFTVYHGKLEVVLPGLPENSVDAVVCDPPYEFGFMGKSWDSSGVAFQPETWAAVLRVAKPGAHLVAFGGSRTFHRLTCAIEDAGWEIRDCLSWLYGSGFPKSLNVQQAMNKAARGCPQGAADPASPNHGKFKGGCSAESPEGRGFGGGAGAFMAEQGAGRGGDEGSWKGWGTALKPAWEPCILARKPLDGTVAANFGKHGTGGLNINGCRIATEESLNGGAYSGGVRPSSAMGCTGEAGGTSSILEAGGGRLPPEAFKQPEGRWPANVVLDEEAAARLDAEVGDRPSGMMEAGQERTQDGGYHGGFPTVATERGTYGDSGGPSRFFYTAKASRSEREEGLENFAALRRSDGREKDIENPRLRTSARKNDHPTVKPIDLMRWLVRLVTPPGGIVLDPFMGSGTTLKAAREEFHPCIGIDMTERYCAIAKARLSSNTLPLS